MKSCPDMKTYLLFLAILITLSLLALQSLANDAPANKPAACPMIAKLCPDGSSVSPQGPKCIMPACPTTDEDLKGPPEDDCNGDDCEGKKTDEEND